MESKSSIVLVSCGKRKLPDAAPAKDLYISPRFQEARKFAETFSDRWFVISAKHGLLSPDSVISPYDLDLDSLSESRQQAWAASVIEGLSKRDLSESNITVLAAGNYASLLRNQLKSCGIAAAFPFLGSQENSQAAILSNLNLKPNRFLDYREFYGILSRLNALPGQETRFGAISGREVDRAGVYFFFDSNESTRFFSPEIQRVVRIGTHAVSKGSKSQLWQRLRTHRGNDDRSGSHRSSIFRLHVGNAMLSLQGTTSLSWGLGDNATNEIRESERSLEENVSEYMRNLSLSYLPILDPASADSDRSYIEMNSIALLTGGGAIDRQSNEWLGNSSPVPEIRQSGLWNINYVGGDYDPRFLEVFDELVERHERGEHSQSSLAPANWRIHMQRGNIGQHQLF